MESMHALRKSKFLGEAQQHHCPFMLFMVNFVPCRTLESKKLEPKSLLGFLPLQFLIVFSLQPIHLSSPPHGHSTGQGDRSGAVEKMLTPPNGEGWT